jgi:uncharacterized protein YndB with AHSA1/START domain
MRFLFLAALAAVAAAAAKAEVTQVSAQGFTVNFREEVQAAPAQAWAAITQLPRWWSDSHTWSGKAANMSLDLAAGGCWCERWDGGHSVMHGKVLMMQPGRVLRLEARLGPLQELPASAVLTLVTGAQDGRTMLRITYRTGGPPEAGLEKLAPAVDRVLNEQFKRLKSFAETGKPD